MSKKNNEKFRPYDDEKLLRRGRSRPLTELIDLSSTPKYKKQGKPRKVSFSPREQILIPELITIPEEQSVETEPIPTSSLHNKNSNTQSKHKIVRLHPFQIKSPNSVDSN